MEIIVITFIIVKYIIIPAVVLGVIAHTVYDLVVKRPRRIWWCTTHEGELIGGEVFYKWCNENNVEPRYFL